MRRELLSVLFLISLVAAASSQGYMGTVTTGAGIIPPVTVGFDRSSGASVGAVSSLVNLTGSWSVDLKDLQIRHLELQIFQDRELMVGAGQLTADGRSQRVTAAGSMAGDRPTLFVSLIDSPQAYRLELDSSGTALSGEYISYAAGQARSSGTATGSVSLATGDREVTVLGESVNPSSSSGAFVGSSVPGQDEKSTPERITKSRSFFQSSNGQTTTTYDGNTVASS